MTAVVWITSVAPAAAVTWDTGPFAISGPGQGAAWTTAAAFPTDELGHQLVGVAYRELLAGKPRVYYRRSQGGETWEAPTLLSGAGAFAASRPALAWVGSKVDAVWSEVASDETSRIMYRSSSDGGATWGDPIPLSPTGTSVGFAKVARDGVGRVIVTYTDENSGKVFVRISVDGGLAFGMRRALGQTSNQPWDGEVAFDAFPTVAVARGVFHLAFFADGANLKYRRSTDLGATWAASRTMSRAGNAFFPQLIASGQQVVIGYSAFSSSSLYAAYRRSTNKGVQWSTEGVLTSRTGNVTFSPVFTATSDSWSVSYERCAPGCTSSAVWTRISEDNGVTFETESRVSHSGPTYAWPLGAAFVGTWVSIYSTLRTSTGAERVWSRLGS